MNAIFQEIFRFGVYKRSQGRIIRQVTLGALAVIVALGCLRLYGELGPYGHLWSVAFPFAFALLCWWISYRLINVPRFADFLISVEAEMHKVSWPSRAELIRASIVVLVTIIFLAGVLFGFDYLWTAIFKFLRLFPRAVQ
ncbi:MAG: preprotein translocase subunit SecE [Thermoguttaceae bacterium]